MTWKGFLWASVLCVFPGCGTVMTVTPYRGAVMLCVAPDYTSTLLCCVTCGAGAMMSSSTQPPPQQRACGDAVSGCVRVWWRAVRPAAFAQGWGSCWARPQKTGAVFIGRVFRDSLSGSVLFKWIMNSLSRSLFYSIFMWTGNSWLHKMFLLSK